MPDQIVQDSPDTATADALALRMWRRLTAAIDSGAPVPTEVSIRPPVVALSFGHDQCPDARAAAAAMVRALGLTGPVTYRDHLIRWGSSEPDANGLLWDVWAHLPGGGDAR